MFPTTWSSKTIVFFSSSCGEEIRPVLGKLGRIARAECDHRHGHGISLMFEEHARSPASTSRTGLLVHRISL